MRKRLVFTSLAVTLFLIPQIAYANTITPAMYTIWSDVASLLIDIFRRVVGGARPPE